MDATTLWIEAMKTVRDLLALRAHQPELLRDASCQPFRDTRLGRICEGVLGLEQASRIALVDGGIEEAFQGSLESCLTQIAVDVGRPWDQSPNRLYVRTVSGKVCVEPAWLRGWWRS